MAAGASGEQASGGIQTQSIAGLCRPDNFDPRDPTQVTRTGSKMVLPFWIWTLVHNDSNSSGFASFTIK